MFIKCAYIIDLLEKSDATPEQKVLIEREINCLINLIMFGDEKRPVTINDIRDVHKKTREFYNQGEGNV